MVFGNTEEDSGKMEPMAQPFLRAFSGAPRGFKPVLMDHGGGIQEPVALVDFLHRYAKNPRLSGFFMQFAGYKYSLL
jgi:hypothetical protein